MASRFGDFDNHMPVLKLMYLKNPIKSAHALSIGGASRTLLINLLVVKSKRQEPREVQ